MTSLHLTVPDDLKPKLEARAAESGYPNLEAYVEALLRADADAADYGAPAHLTPQSREELESFVAQGMQSPARPMTKSDWDQLRRDLVDRQRSSGNR